LNAEGARPPFLRLLSSDTEGDRLLLADAEARLAAASTDVERLRTLGDVAELYRLLGDIPQATDASFRAIALARVLGDGGREAAHLVRLATALQFDDRHAEALEAFSEVLRRRDEPGFEPYEHFAEQHMGKCLAELGRVDEARQAFERALVTRRLSRNDGWIAATRAALDALPRSTTS
jgi:tetratricopeptide (TPR) repeat protein